MAFTGKGAGRFQMTKIRKGDSAISVYLASTSVPSTPAAAVTFPPVGGWSATAPTTAAENSLIYRLDGAKNELTGVYTWFAPYVIGRGPRGSGFYRISRTGVYPTTVGIPTLAEYRTATGISDSEFVVGDIAAIVYATPNLLGEASSAFEYNGTTWVAAASFVDGNLIVDGSVFSTVSYGVGISNINSALNWADADATIPTIDPTWGGSGAFMGFADNDTTGSDETQEVLLVGDAQNHFFFDGQTIVLSGIRLEDPTILVTETPDAGLTAWVTSTLYELGDLVTYMGDIYQCILEHTSGTILPTDTMYWDNITAAVAATNTFVPAVYVGATAPASATEGDLWYDETLGRMFIFYTSTWADVTKN